jgi:hypothetical protein
MALRRLTRASLWTLLCAALTAAPDMPSGIFRGSLEALEGTPAGGQITARAPDDTVASCTYDARTYFERDKVRVNSARLQPGDPIEVLADRRPGSRICYARTVHVVAPPLSAPALRLQERNKRRSAVLLPRGDLTLAGLVIRHEPGRLVLRTRDGEVTLAIRPDTRYLNGGVGASEEDVVVNTRVSVRAGRNLLGAIEAYQVFWGEIGEPR